ncbi:hypothetical protein [Sphingobium sp. KCTC 72723]|uniref:hypothetical protein n=1 Tax=Sphingobium sp. KCTC 72723 TaxID=2733867 RepID=UPI00165E38C1|nr:hypothetical protein [Sphingobium sp. KCTC 72723]
MRFYEFATAKPTKPRQPKKPMTPEQSLIAARKRDVDIAKQAMQSVKDRQKQKKEAEKARRVSYIGKLQPRPN